MREARRGTLTERIAGILFILVALVATPSCHNGRWSDGVPAPSLSTSPGTSVQKGTVTLRDGEEAQVNFQTPFVSLPRLTITGLNQSSFRKEPYRKDDFEIVDLQSGYFKIQSNHHEPGSGSWAVVEWRAEGIKERPDHSSKEQLVALVKRLGGDATIDGRVAGAPAVRVDLHRTRVTDDDLKLLEGMSALRTLNLYGTGISDAGLAHLSGLTGLKVLYLNDTAITDQGLAYLQRMTALQELGLNRTNVTDAGLVVLARLPNLQKLSLGSKQITDAGLKHLTTVRSLMELVLVGSQVTDSGVAELKRALPRVVIIR